jgi:hypothetical protein
MAATAAALGALLLAPQAAQAFYLPGVAPANFIEGQRVELKVCTRGSIDCVVLCAGAAASVESSD